MAGLSEAELQEQYNKAKSLMNSLDCLVKNSDKATTLKRAAKRFEALGEFKDSSDLAAKCLADAEKYSKMEDHLPPAPKNPLDLKKPSRASVWIARIIAVLVIVVILGLFYTRMTDHGTYLRSSFYEAIGNHEKAYKMFLKLDDYKDSQDKYLENRYKYACEQLAKKKYDKAKLAFRAIREYKDSGDKLATAEIKLIKKAKKHDDVMFGEGHWIVAEKKKDKVFLIRVKPTSGIAYNITDDKVTWKTSSIREYLNSTYMDTMFTNGMKKKILTTKVVVKDNKEFGTKGCTTKDKIFMLNEDQAYKYGEDLSLFLRDFWLIGPGETQREAQFVSYGQVKEAGYPVDDRYINTRPCLWVSTK